jgi:hypothetical protein
MDNPVNNDLEFFVRGILVEAFLKNVLVELFEAFHPGTVSHHYHALHYLLLVLPDVFETQEEQHFEVLKNVRVMPLHQLHVV